MSEEFVCPLPQFWNEIHQNLIVARSSSENISIPKPPVPLILNGWMFSSDKEKSIRWKETVEWAGTYGFSNLIPELKESEKHFGKSNETFNYGDDFVSNFDDENE